MKIILGSPVIRIYSDFKLFKSLLACFSVVKMPFIYATVAPSATQAAETMFGNRKTPVRAMAPKNFILFSSAKNPDPNRTRLD
jgi:hypothetical protein